MLLGTRSCHGYVDIGVTYLYMSVNVERIAIAGGTVEDEINAKMRQKYVLTAPKGRLYRGLVLTGGDNPPKMVQSQEARCY